MTGDGEDYEMTNFPVFGWQDDGRLFHKIMYRPRSSRSPVMFNMHLKCKGDAYGRCTFDRKAVPEHLSPCPRCWKMTSETAV